MRVELAMLIDHGETPSGLLERTNEAKPFSTRSIARSKRRGCGREL